jgi:hypothetical protein
MLTVEFDDPSLPRPLDRHMALVRRILGIAAKEDDIFLFLEDDLDFNLHLLHNVSAWSPPREVPRGGHFFASLYNPGVQFQKTFPELSYAEAWPKTALGTQALLLSPATAQYMVTCWGVEPGPHADIKLARLAARVCPLYYHLPSLVQHVGVHSLWNGPFHSAVDFDKEWKSPL